MAKKPTVTTLQSGFNSTEVLNSNFENIADAFENTLSLDGSTPNALESDLDLNNNNILNANALIVNGSDVVATTAAALAAATTAQADAEAAVTASEASETAAAASAAAAGLSATSAASSATASAASAVDATNNGAAQVVLAAEQVALAETAKTAAELAETNAETAETNAAASASAALASETAAVSSAGVAALNATSASNSASSASTSASNAASSASSASASADAALSALDNFDDRYLGQKTSDPATDNDGDPLVAGALYFNTTDDIMKVYDGSLWVAAYASLSGTMIGANNLSDVSDAAASRTNLGLGTGNTPTFAGINTTGNLSFGDNDKAIFGAGSDLQIYHDGGNSYIADTATGSLHIKGTSLFLEDADGNEFIRMSDQGSGGVVYLKNLGATKLTTTSTGVDITGTLTSDGLTVDGVSALNNNVTITQGTTPTLTFTSYPSTQDTVATIYSGRAEFSGPNSFLRFGTNDGTSTKLRMDISQGGDISFYEDTGTTAKFFWDASAEELRVSGEVFSEGFRLKDSAGAWRPVLSMISDDTVIQTGTTTGNRSIVMKTEATERMRINASGNVGIGTDAPSEKLDVTGNITANANSSSTYARIRSSDTGVASLYFGNQSDAVTASISMRHDSGNALQFNGYNNAERMRINASGNVGIGKTNPATPLDVNGTVTATAFAGDGSSLTGIAAGAGGGGSDEIFWENGQNVTSNYTITNGKNAMSAGPITINSGVTVTVGAGETWTVI